MSFNFDFFKLKKISQDIFYKSIEEKLNITTSQTYVPCFSKYLKFHNDYSKKMFCLKDNYVLLEFLDVDEKTKNRLQGKVKVKMIKNEFYTKSKDYEDYKNYIVEKEIFIKSNPILDVLQFMEGCYDFNSIIPSSKSYETNKKINNWNNNAYIEIMGCYILNKLNKNNYTNIFPEFYGCFNGISKSYEHDISEDYNFINSDDWFMEKNGTEFEIIHDNSLADFDKLSLENLEKLNMKKMKGGADEIELIDSDVEIDLDIDMEEIYKQKEISISKSNSSESNDSCSSNINCSEDDSSISDSSSDGTWFTDSSNESVICADYWAKVSNIPIEILCIESFETTLTDLEREGIEELEWLGILFELSFGLAAGQKHLNYIHNDLHSDNIMFNKTDEKYRYFKYEDIYYKIPTFGREIKIIDFARSIFKVKNHIYYSDVFERNGDAGGQYGYPPSKFLKTKMNYNFDLARLATTIIEYFDTSSPIFNLLMEWTNFKEDGISKNFVQLDDNFSLYITITKYARNSLPKNQLKKEIFNLFRIEKDSIPENKIIYEF
jgi:hypothetical protein